VIGYLLVGLLVFLSLVASAPRPRRRVVALPMPRTWDEFKRWPIPLRADNVPLRSSDGKAMDVATVYNRSAALLRMRSHVPNR
jgi:hypothetical protein